MKTLIFSLSFLLVKKKIFLINTFFILHFLNKYLNNRYQITNEEIKSLVIFSIIYILFLNITNLFIYFIFSKRIEAIFIVSILFFISLYYGDITYFFYFNNFELIMRIPNYSFLTFVLIYIIIVLVSIRLKIYQNLNPYLFFYTLLIIFINFPISINENEVNREYTLEAMDYKFDKTPDIYYFLLDGYPNLKIAEDYYLYDSEKIYRLFNENNVEVFESSSAPYNRTIYALSSIFEMDYLFEPPEVSFRERESLLKNYENAESSFEEIIRENGYQIIKYGNKAFCSDLDICLNDQFENLNSKNTVYYDLILETPLKILIEKDLISSDYILNLICSVGCEKSVIDESIENILKEINRKKTKPIFAFIHLMNSHDPYILNSNCELSDDPSYNLAIENISQFKENLDCSFLEMNRIFKSISSNDNIIIFQSDHGPQFQVMKNTIGNNIDSLNTDQLINRYSTLSASNLNLFCKDKVISFSSINTFRWVLKCLSDKNIEIKKEKNYLLFGSVNSSIFDVTREFIDAKN